MEIFFRRAHCQIYYTRHFSVPDVAVHSVLL